MLTLTKKSEYALVAVCHLATEPDKVVSARDIAEKHCVPLPLLMNVLKTLNQQGYVTSTRGARGGYTLAVEPGSISLNDLVEAIEGPVSFVPCATPSENGKKCCERVSICTLRQPLHGVHRRFREFLSSVNVAELAFDKDSHDHAAPHASRVIAQ